MTDQPPLAIHLAAGEGTRLRPLTEDCPKPLVELGGASLLERNVETMNAAGIEDQLVVTGHCAEQVDELGYETVHNPVYDETDMVYSLFCAEDHFPTDRDLIISYGDIVYEQSVVEALLNCDDPLCVVVDREWRRLWQERFEDPLEDAETLSLDEKGAIEEIGNEPNGFDEIDAQYIGLLKIRADHLSAFSDLYYELSDPESGETRSGVEMTHFIQRLVDDGWTVRGISIDGGWLEVDTTEDLETYRERFDDETLETFVSLNE